MFSDHTVSRWSVRLGACGWMEKSACYLLRDSPQSTSLHFQCTHLWAEGGSWCFSHCGSNRKSRGRKNRQCDTAMRRGATSSCLPYWFRACEEPIWEAGEPKKAWDDAWEAAEPGMHTRYEYHRAFALLLMDSALLTTLVQIFPSVPWCSHQAGISPESVPVSLYWVEEKPHCVMRKTFSILQVLPNCLPVCLCHFE